MPRHAAVDDVRLTRRFLRGRAVLPAESVLPRRRIQARLAIEGFLARARVPVDGARVVGQRVDARPVDVDGVLVGLPDRAGVAGAGERDALQIGFADFSSRGGEKRRRVDVAGRKLLRGQLCSQQQRQGYRDANPHVSSPLVECGEVCLHWVWRGGG